MDIGKFREGGFVAWLPLLPGVDDTPEILCGYLSQKEYDEAREKATAYKGEGQQRTAETDEKKMRRLISRQIVRDWRGLEDDGSPYPCTPENIDYLMEVCTEFRMLVMGAPMSLAAMLQAEKEALRKNSGTSPGQVSSQMASTAPGAKKNGRSRT